MSATALKLTQEENDFTSCEENWSNILKDYLMTPELSINPINADADENPLTNAHDESSNYYTDRLNKTISIRSFRNGFESKIKSVVSTPTTEIEEILLIWEGVVLTYQDGEITARVRDKLKPEMPEEIVVIDAREIDDRELAAYCRPGAMFYWHIGHRSGSFKQKESVSIIRFRRLPKWSNYEIEQASKTAKEYSDFFRTITTDSTTS